MLVITLALIDYIATLYPSVTKADGTAWMIGPPSEQVCVIAIGTRSQNDVRDAANWCLDHM